MTIALVFWVFFKVIYKGHKGIIYLIRINIENIKSHSYKEAGYKVTDKLPVIPLQKIFIAYVLN